MIKMVAAAAGAVDLDLVAQAYYIVSVLENLRQGDQNFRTSLGHLVRPCPKLRVKREMGCVAQW